MKKGYTLIEILVVVTVFSVISLITSQTIILTLRGTKKAESISKVRTTLDAAVGAMERQLRGAKSIVSACTGAASQSIIFVDQNNNQVTFSCIGVNNNNQPASIASGSASLTTADVTISACSFTCTPAAGNNPPSVLISVTGNDLTGQGSSVPVVTQVTLRNF